jgi:TolA-binding protein
MINHKTALAGLFFCTSAFCAEVSVFGAGDLSSDKPYGLTKTEQFIYNNKKEIQKLNSNFFGYKEQNELILERIEGLESIVEGDSNSIYEIKKEIKLLKDEIERNKLVSEQLLNDYKNLSLKQSKEYEELKANIQAIALHLKKYTEEKTTKTTKKKSNKTIFNEAVALFKKDHFSKAIPMFEYLISKKYMPATSNYYLGEIHYFRKKYNEALAYYKTSITLYDKASFTHRLLYHSAVSFEQINDHKNAMDFYRTLIELYPKSKFIKPAKANLKKLEEQHNP